MPPPGALTSKNVSRKGFLKWGNAKKGEVAYVGRSVSHEGTKTRRISGFLKIFLA